MSRLGRPAAHRWAMLRTQVTQLIQHERIETTLAKAKELRKLADRVVTFGKKGDHRGVHAILFDTKMQSKLFNELVPRYTNREGGYTRVLRSRLRQHDRAVMAYVEYVDRPGELRTARPPQTKDEDNNNNAAATAEKSQ